MTPPAPCRASVITEDGALLAVLEYGVPSSTAASVVFLPALGVPVGYYHRLLAEWGSTRHIVALEMRGMPQSPVGSLRRADHGYSSAVHFDIPALLSIPSLRTAPATVLVGHSLGGQIALLAAAAGRATPDAIVTIGSGTSASHAQPTPRRRLIRTWQIATIDIISRVLHYWPGHRFHFAGPQSRRTMQDWAYEARNGRYQLSGDPFDYETALARLTTPTLLISLPDDELITTKAVEHLAHRLHKSHVHVLERVSESPTNHFTWARATPTPIITFIETWLRNHI